jgi:hypothetical protein
MEAGIIYKNDKKRYHYKGAEKPMPNDATGEIFDGTSQNEVPF